MAALNGSSGRSDPPRAVQFAVVREDPRVEIELLRAAPEARRALLICSGGCTALALRRAFPDLRLTLLDPNEAQLARFDDKLAAATERDAGRRRRLLNVDDPAPGGLAQDGNFEALFRLLRGHWLELVAPAAAWEAALRPGGDSRALLERVRSSPHWAASFAACFHDDVLHAMFGPDATQHARPGSYAPWFRTSFERMLSAPDAASNPFLHHVIHGCYAADRALPEWLIEGLGPSPDDRGVERVHGTLDAVGDLGGFDFVGLSNVPDWLDPSQVRRLIGRLAEELRPGAMVLQRRLNNPVDAFGAHGGAFAADPQLDQRLLALDRSGFYGAVCARVRCEPPTTSSLLET